MARVLDQVANQQGLRDYVLRRLGHPTVHVELSTEQLDDAIYDALRLFSRYLMVLRSNVARNQAQSVRITLSEQTLGVHYVCFLFPQEQRIVAQMNIFEILYRMIYPQLPLGEWYMLRSFYEMYQRVRGTEPDWQYDPETRVLSLDCWSGPYDVFYVTSEEISVEALLSGSRRRFQQNLLDLTLAYAKERLVPIRGKFGDTIPAPGGSLHTDASRLATEAASVIKAQEDMLKASARGYLVPTWG